MSNKEPKVIGIGGILFKSKNPEKLLSVLKRIAGNG